MSVKTESTEKTPWNDFQEREMAKYVDWSKCYNFMLDGMYDKINTTDYRVNVSSKTLEVIVASLTGIFGATVVGGFQLNWLLCGLGIVNVVVSYAYKRLEYEARMSEIKNLQRQWSVLHYDIQRQITLPRAVRVDSIHFMNNIQERLANIEPASNALIDQNTQLSCKEEFKSVPNFMLPTICGQVQHAEVCTYDNYGDSNRHPLLPRASAEEEEHRAIALQVNTHPEDYVSNTDLGARNTALV
jgi:hypothetical protein